MDVLHECCLGVLDGSGVCCESGVLDDGGVCDGDHSSCRKVLQLDILLPDLTSAASLTTPAVQKAFRCFLMELLCRLISSSINRLL